QRKLALESWRGAIKRNPLNAGYREELAVLLAENGDWPAARTEAQEAVRLDPARAFARTVLAAAVAGTGDVAQGETMMRTVEALAPANLPELRRWYEANKTPR